MSIGKRSVVGAVTLSYVIASYLYWGVVFATSPAPHPGSGLLILGWLVAPVLSLQFVSHPEGYVQFAWLLATTAGCLASLCIWPGIDARKRFLRDTQPPG